MAQIAFPISLLRRTAGAGNLVPRTGFAWWSMIPTISPNGDAKSIRQIAADPNSYTISMLAFR